MNKFIILLIAFLMAPLSLSLAAEDIQYSREDEIAVSIIDPEIRINDHFEREFLFYLHITNNSLSKKIDLELPFQIDVSDEFDNRYHSRSKDHQRNEMTSLYPSNKVVIPCRFQAPVSTAKEINVKLADASHFLRRDLNLRAEEIKNWIIKKKIEVSVDDIQILYPREKRIFMPGDTVYLKIEFSKEAGKPTNLHVVLADYMLSDEQASGQYELQIPTDAADGDLQVVVMGEWGDSPENQVVSKTLHLKIKGKS